MKFLHPSPATRAGRSTPLFGLFLLLSMTSAPASAQSLVNGGVVNGTIAVAGEQDTYTFNASIGEGFQLRVVDVNTTTLYPKITLYDPSGASVVVGAGYNVGAITQTAASTGTYSVVVEDGNTTPVTGSYSIYFVRAPGANQGGALINGGEVSGRISMGDLDSFTFSVNVGDNYKLRLADVNYTTLYPRMTLYDPSGVHVKTAGAYNVAAMDGTATRTGTYTLIVADGNTAPDKTGDYSVQFVRLPGANANGPLVNGGKVSGTIDLGDLDSYTFELTTGENFQLRTADVNYTTLYPKMSLYDPSGVFVTSAGAYNVAAINGIAARTGTYTLIIADGNTAPDKTGDYEVYFVRVPGADENGALINGGVVSDTIDLGDLDSFTLDLVVGESFQLRLADVNFTTLYPKMSLYDPSGVFVTSAGGYNVAAINGTASYTGTYSLIVSDGNTAPDKTGVYDVFFARLPGAAEHGALVNGEAVSGKIDLGDLDTYTLSLNVGENFQLRIADVNYTTLYPKMTLYDPSGLFVASGAGYNVGAISATAAYTGTYTLVVSDGNTAPDKTGNYDLHYVQLPGANEGGLLLDGAAALGRIDLGDLDSFTFLGTAGQMAQVTIADTGGGNFRPKVALYGRFGEFITTASGATSATLSYTVIHDGIYTVVAYDGNTSGDEVGPYSIVVNGSGVNPKHPANTIFPPEFPTDPILSDIGGDAGLGPKIGDSSEPFNFAIDCTGASGAGVYAMELWSGIRPIPVATQWGLVYLAGSRSFRTAGVHTQSVETWFPSATGLVVPNDSALVGLSYTVQGFCGRYNPGGRLTSAVTQTIGF